jgi:hypothetical protein
VGNADATGVATGVPAGVARTEVPVCPHIPMSCILLLICHTFPCHVSSSSYATHSHVTRRFMTNGLCLILSTVFFLSLAHTHTRSLALSFSSHKKSSHTKMHDKRSVSRLLQRECAHINNVLSVLLSLPPFLCLSLSPPPLSFSLPLSLSPPLSPSLSLSTPPSLPPSLPPSCFSLLLPHTQPLRTPQSLPILLPWIFVSPSYL